MWTVITRAVSDWLRHHDARLGAALAYYAVFSLGPLLLIVVSIAGLFSGGDAVREALAVQFRALLGPAGSQAVEAMPKGAGSPGSASGIVGVVLLVAALGVVVQFKDALNIIWETEDPASAGVWWNLRTYPISFAGILGLGFLLSVSLVVSTPLSAFSSWLGGGESLFWQAVDFLVSVGMLAALLCMLFKWFPDADVRAGRSPSKEASRHRFSSTSASSPIKLRIKDRQEFTQVLKSTPTTPSSVKDPVPFHLYPARL